MSMLKEFINHQNNISSLSLSVFVSPSSVDVDVDVVVDVVDRGDKLGDIGALLSIFYF